MLAHQIKTASDLKMFVESRGSDSHFFTRQTMRFHGDTMRNYGVRKTTIRTAYDSAGAYVGPAGVECEAWELYRRRPVKHGVTGSAYFHPETFARVFPVSV